MIDPTSKLSIRKQCKVLQLNRSGLYYKSRGETALNLELMRLMDAHYLEHPYKGAGRMHTWLVMDLGYEVSLNRVERLYYQVMGLRAILPGPHTSKRNKVHRIYPYLLRELEIDHSNQVWAMDITYIPMERGFLYLTAIIDVYSRYVINWSLSNTMTAEWCKEVMQSAIEIYGKPEIVNTDQGVQFTAEVFSQFILGEKIKLSMDGKGRAIDNVFIERLWRNVKYEKVYLHPSQDGIELHKALNEYFHFYNTERRHQGIHNALPKEMYFNTLRIRAA